MKVKATKIKNRWHIRLFDKNDKVIDECACENRLDIGYACRDVLRWQSKMGSIDPHITSARRRHNEDNKPIGKIWYNNKLKEEKRKINGY